MEGGGFGLQPRARFEKSMKEDIMHFLVASALKLSAYGKLMLLSLLKGVGSEVMLVEEVELLLNELLNRRHQFHLGNDQLCMKLSKIEVDTMCLLLEVIQFQVTMMMALLLPWEPLRVYLTRFNREKVTIINCDVPTAIEAFRRGLERESLLYEELTKYPCRTMDDMQAKSMAQVRLEEDIMEEDEKYYKQLRKIMTPRSSVYKPYTRPNRDEVHINST
ncbi:hypothetical protein AgCh_034199 [Apium graveolens]